MNLAHKIRAHLRTLSYLLKTGISLPVLAVYFRTYALQLAQAAEIRRTAQEARDQSRTGGSFTTDWFTDQVWFWEDIIVRQNLARSQVRVLEIGCWEGRSSCYILQRLPACRLVAVDTWKGSDENGPEPGLASIEKKFDANTRRFKGRVKKFKGTSATFFRALPTKQPSFDLIYVDGSHRADDVLHDALSSFAVLKPGGIMILDDYLNRFYPQEDHNPASAIHAFLRLKAKELELLYLSNQVYLRKHAA